MEPLQQAAASDAKCSSFDTRSCAKRLLVIVVEHCKPDQAVIMLLIPVQLPSCSASPAADALSGSITSHLIDCNKI